MKKQKNSLLTFKAKSIDLNAKEHEAGTLNNGFSYPVVIKAGVDGVDLSEWFKRNKQEFELLYNTHGAVLLRGFTVNAIDGFSAFSHEFDENVLSYTQQSLESIYKHIDLPFSLVYVDGRSPTPTRQYLQ
ncbi:MAG: TauD/TfdA family dioxygenase, partial [Bacteroidia bacterium]|nr:TauD/TfdA family dioxygenase [Bacteroidia bacterium]